jgi:hypothetical protein
MGQILALLTLVLVAALPAAAQGPPPGIVGVTGSGRSLEVRVSLPGGIGAEVALGFEDVEGLDLANLGVSAHLVHPLSLWSRLPRSVLPALPMVLRVEPPAAGGLSFRGVASFGIHTRNLHFVPGSPLRLFAAPLGGRFEDITAGMGAGSYRARGTRGGFSEFIVVLDLRRTREVIAAKFDRLEELLEGYHGAMPGSVYYDLEERLEAAREDYERGALASAIAEIDGFVAVVEAHSGTDIPDVWRAARDVDNVAGYLRGAAATLRFSLDLKRGH